MTIAPPRRCLHPALPSQHTLRAAVDRLTKDTPR